MRTLRWHLLVVAKVISSLKSSPSCTVSLKVWTLHCSTRGCSSIGLGLCLAQSYSVSPKLWQSPRTFLWNAAARKWWVLSLTPCFLKPFMESFPVNASMIASTPCLALQAQCFAFKQVPQASLDPIWMNVYPPKILAKVGFSFWLSLNMFTYKQKE